MGRVVSVPSSSRTWTALAPIVSSSRRAEPASERERASIQRPSRMKVMVPQAASK